MIQETKNFVKKRIQKQINLLKISIVFGVFAIETSHNLLLSKWQKTSILKKGKFKKGQSSALSKRVRCESSSKRDISTLHDVYLIIKCKCQKPVTLTLTQFPLDSSGFENKKNTFNGTQKAWDKFMKPGRKTTSRPFSATVGANTENHQLAETASIILKSISGGKVLSLTDMHGNGLRLRVM